MKKFKGSIIIVDPCYVAKDEDWGTTFNWNLYQIGNNIFSNYIWEATNIGEDEYDIVSVNSKITKETILQSHLEDYLNKEDEPNKSCYEFLDNFCTDSDTFGIFYLDEVLKYNPNFLEECNEDYYAIIKDYDGRINTFEDAAGDFHILSLGNKIFFTV